MLLGLEGPVPALVPGGCGVLEDMPRFSLGHSP
jgi:hypothetical protein